ncbi:hypothetical protein [Commensalibacter nepenthis]|uniref:Uncharacterized protein n=1 Tax=Commensalibacter nepenthis TaxID=3043872 RepID=A0ABT6Q5B0_9PROT|nr:hypothetical protein [Commensalibacter sp. TBRC 10068]MDI2112093.1 hypothetical protein [Commensalibacter sp. TBRC 10068]
MDSIVIFKAGMIGGLGFIIALGAAIALLTFPFKSSQLNMAKVSKLPSLITLVLVCAIGWGLSYWYLFMTPTVNNPSGQTILILFASLFTLTPSLAIVSAAFVHYIKIQKALSINQTNEF